MNSTVNQEGQFEANEFYERRYHKVRHEHLLQNDEYFWSRARASAKLYFTNEERKKRIFEYGCGIGQGIAALPNGSGWDVSGEARAACRRRGIHVFDSLDDVPKRTWDIVFCRHVLEHVVSPFEALAEMREMLNGDGELYLVLPKERQYRCSLLPDLNQHLYCWNFRAINNLLHRAGLTPTVNSHKYILGYRALLPVRRRVGEHAYLQLARFVGWLKNNGELIVRAKRSEGSFRKA